MSLYTKFTSASLALALLFCCTACHKDDAPQKKGYPNQKALRFYLQSEPLSMDPRKGGNRISQVVLRELFEGLMRIDAEGRPSFAVANSVDVSEDKLNYTFHLRPTLWSNGMPVTAHDFEYAWKTMITPSFPTTYSYAFYCIKNARKAHLGQESISNVGIRAVDNYTLHVTLEHPVPYFIELTSNPVYSPICRAITEHNSDWNNAAGPNFVSNGPFVLNDWKHRTEIVLAKNENYWDAQAVAVEKMTFPIIENPQTALNMYECGDLDWVGDPFGDLPLDAIPKLKAEKKLQLRQIGSSNWLEVNVKHPVLSSPKIRQALAMAINRQEIVDHLLQGGEKPAYTILPETLTLLARPTFRDNDLETAKKLFEDGLNDLQLSRETLPPLAFCHYAEPLHKALAEAIQQQWRKGLGIEAYLCPADRNTHLTRVAAGDFDVASMTWFTFYHDPIYNLELLKYCSGFNGTHWQDPRYAQLLDESDREANLAARDSILQEAEEFLMKEMPIIPLCYNTSKFVKNENVFGESLSPIGMIELKNMDVTDNPMFIDR